MLQDCLAAKRVLDTGYSCVICYNGMVLTSNKDSIYPLVDFLDSKFDFSMFSICMKTISKSSAILIAKLGIKNAFTYNITLDAKNVFDKYEINYRYNELVLKTSDELLDKLIESIDDVDSAVNKLYDEIKK